MNPGFADIPEQFETGRLLIGMLLPGDGTEMNVAVLASYEALHP